MSLRDIVRSKGGDLYAGGRRASIPAPGHSRLDRSASLLIGRSGRVVAYSFGAATVSEILADLRGSGLIDAAGLPASISTVRSSTPVPTDGDKIRRAVELWGEGIPISGTLSERHLQAWRAVSRPLENIRVLRHHPRLPVAIYAAYSHVRLPALMSMIEGPSGRPTAIEVTYLDALGQRTGALRLSRKTIGRVPEGACVQLDPWCGHMLVGEGVITTLSATEILRLPGAALLGTGNMRHWRPPAGVSHLTIATDRGPAGEAAAAELARAMTELGIGSNIALPDAPFEDFNRMAQALRASGKGEGGGERLAVEDGPHPVRS